MYIQLLQYAFNLFSHNSSVVENGYNEEEMKLVKETRKIWVNSFFKLCFAGFNWFYEMGSIFV